MDSTLKRLMTKMPPPPDPTGRNVDWERSEAEIGLTYPASFKEFIGVYGASIWFDNLTPLYPELTSYKDAKTFLAAVKAKLQLLVKYKILDEKYHEVAMPLYPEEGGLFPFLADYNGWEYFWQTTGKNPDKWPVVCWKMGPIVLLGRITIAKMILDFLERKPRMIAVWGDIRDYEPERIRLDRWIPPKPSKRSRR
jgi:hypothetical protein